MDTPIYERYGDAIVHEKQVPYRDFAVEYPPAALPAFVAPSIAADPGDFGRYARLFEALMLLCGAAAAALVGYVLTLQRARPWRIVAGTLVAGLAPLALGPVVLSRFDLWPAALTIGALAALAADRRRLSFALLGGGIATSATPAFARTSWARPGGSGSMRSRRRQARASLSRSRNAFRAARCRATRCESQTPMPPRFALRRQRESIPAYSLGGAPSAVRARPLSTFFVNGTV